jgi:hypothetical protein
MSKLRLATFLILFSAAAFAQNSYPQTEFFAALSDDGHTGFLASLAYLPVDHLGVEGDISAHFGNVHRQHFDFGPRAGFMSDDGKFGGFAHLLFGASHESTSFLGDTSFSWVFGGAGEYNFTSNWGGRVQIDLVRTHFGGGAQNDGRYSFGVVYHFGQ